jgi:hypothetical protein
MSSITTNPLVGGPLESEISRSYNSFSGSDIRAVIGTKQFAELQAVSYNVTREKAPIYTMGSPDPRAFSRNKRGIAGGLIWINFDRHALLNVFWKADGQFISNIDDIRPQFSGLANAQLDQSAIFSNTPTKSVGGDNNAIGNFISGLDNVAIDKVSGLKAPASHWYSDQILPFDITLAANNELGAASAMKIVGVEILNEGSGVSIDDAVTEMQATFVARYVEPWAAVYSPFGDQNA